RTPHTLAPDRLETSKKTPRIEAIANDKLVLDDGSRKIEVYHQVGTDHNDGIVMVYLPTEKILVEVDAWNTESVTAPRSRNVNPYMVNLHDNITRLGLDVVEIVPLHGPRTGTMKELEERIRPAN
ncbi:MAG: MBL fold metallo-hydrolase, partial [Acidobacteriota bacterium]